MIRGKKGDWIQVFLILFFVLIVLIAIIMLGMQKSVIEVEKPGLDYEIRQEYAQTQLIGILRSTVMADTNGDGRNEEVTLAELISMNTDRTHDALIRDTFKARIPHDYGYRFEIYSVNPIIVREPDSDGAWVSASWDEASVLLPPSHTVKLRLISGLAEKKISDATTTQTRGLP